MKGLHVKHFPDISRDPRREVAVRKAFSCMRLYGAGKTLHLAIALLPGAE